MTWAGLSSNDVDALNDFFGANTSRKYPYPWDLGARIERLPRSLTPIQSTVCPATVREYMAVADMGEAPFRAPVAGEPRIDHDTFSPRLDFTWPLVLRMGPGQLLLLDGHHRVVAARRRRVPIWGRVLDLGVRRQTVRRDDPAHADPWDLAGHLAEEHEHGGLGESWFDALNDSEDEDEVWREAVEHHQWLHHLGTAFGHQH